jgi:hypothetical protein
MVHAWNTDDDTAQAYDGAGEQWLKPRQRIVVWRLLQYSQLHLVTGRHLRCRCAGHLPLHHRLHSRANTRCAWRHLLLPWTTLLAVRHLWPCTPSLRSAPAGLPKGCSWANSVETQPLVVPGGPPATRGGLGCVLPFIFQVLQLLQRCG